ncbi:HD domain-containing protein [Actinophytocola sp.]|uniref:HD domain-containing protein n=1 Tax=Actinophytocola sp. TaxID=1872138 RepID=UPI002D7EDFA6|nr:HD domain-containing protein [Actinophytocola sp.]HET9144098.1 HD domain-containing protein [Actinophytocola sp.]
MRNQADTAKWPPTTDMGAAGLYHPIKKMADLALRFATVNRATRLPDGSPESDADHTVMLAWLAPALAARCTDSLDVGLVCQFAVVHDAVEALAGDTPTLKISPQEWGRKIEREARSAESIARMFGATLPWFPEMILRYEQRDEAEARFVWALDKVIVKIANLFAGCHDITVQGLTVDDFVDMRTEQRPKLDAVTAQYTWGEGLLRVYDRLCAEVEARLRELALPVGALDNEAAQAVTFEQSGHVAVSHEPGSCPDGEDGRSCMFCDGGLFACERCNSFEGATTTHCPGERMTAEQHDAVYAGDLDYRRRADGTGEWLPVGSPHTPNRGWESARLAAEVDNFSIDKVIDYVMRGQA